MKPFGRSTIQLMSILVREEGKGKINWFACNWKTHSTLGEKKNYSSLSWTSSFSNQNGWVVSRYNYEHYTFEQSKFKKNFVVMNQKSRQKSTTQVERDFLKLPNNFGIDFRSNIDNCVLEPLHDDWGKTSYVKKFTTIFNKDTFRHFFT